MHTQRFRRTIMMSAVTLALLAGLPRDAKAAPVFIGPSPYLSFADSPFNVPGFTYLHLETFEDGALNTPGTTASPGWAVLSPGVFTDSVDGDDGTIDGSGTAGRSFFSGSTQPSLTITFNAAALGGQLPTHAGIAWTDVGNVTSGTVGFGDVTLSAMDAMGVALGSITGTNLGNGSALGSGSGAVAEDRFFGVTNAGGISSITISMNNSVDWEVDHLQYGNVAVVPEPSTVLLLGMSLVGLLGYGWRRRGNKPKGEDGYPSSAP